MKRISKRRFAKAHTPIKRLMRMRQITMTDLGDLLEVSRNTASSYVRNPIYMNGVMRSRMAVALKIDISKMDDICNGRKAAIERLFLEEGD